MKHYRVIGIVLLLFVLIGPLKLHAEEGLVKDLGTVKQYTVNDQMGKVLVSRDGSEAKSIKPKTIINQPGTYYLTSMDQDEKIAIYKFTIKQAADKNQWRIKSTNELPEILKYTLENYKTQISIQFETGSYTIDQLGKIMDEALTQVTNQYPGLYWVSYELTSYGVVKPRVQLTLEYADPSTAKLKQEKIRVEKEMDALITQLVNSSMKDYERQWVICDALIKRITYDWSMKGNRIYTMQGTWVDQKGVCSGYARSAMYLLNNIGIPTRYITGETDQMSHGWNLSNIQGQYYHVDITWADQEKNGIGTLYPYINETDSYMKLTHRWDEKAYPKATATAYVSVNVPLDLTGVYRITSQDEWRTLKKTLGKDQLKDTNMIFYGVKSVGWDVDELIDEITQAERASIQYNTDQKYDCLVINYRVD